MVCLLRCVSVDNDPFFEQVLRAGVLWGYPDLFEKLYGEVRSALIEEREKRRESKKEKQRGTMVEYVDNLPEVMEGEDDTLSAPPQFSPPVPFDDGFGLEVMAHIDTHPDSKTRPIDHPPASNEHHLSTVIIETTEELDPTPEIKSRSQILPIEIEEVPGPDTLDANNKELRVAQS